MADPTEEAIRRQQLEMLAARERFAQQNAQTPGLGAPELEPQPIPTDSPPVAPGSQPVVPPIPETPDNIGMPEEGVALERPGFFKRTFLHPADAIAERVAEGFDKGFGPSPLGTTRPAIKFETAPISAIGQSITRGVLSLGEFGLRTAVGLFQGATEGFNQTLLELGVRETTANQVTRDMVALSEVAGIAAITAPVKSVGEAGTTMFRMATRAEKVERLRALERARRVQLEAERAANRARREAEEHMKGVGQTDLPPSAQKLDDNVTGPLARAEVDVAEGKLADMEVEARAAAFLRAPDEILDEIPVFTTQVLNQDGVRKAIQFAADELGRRGVPVNGLEPERVSQLVLDMLNTGKLDYRGFAADLQAAGLSKENFIMLFGHTKSEAGRVLNQLSQFRKLLRAQAFKGDQAAADWLAEIARTGSARAAARRSEVETGKPADPLMLPSEVGAPFYVRSGRLFRQLIISLPSTAARNLIESGLIRSVLSTADRAIDTSMRRVFTPNAPIETINPFDEMGRIFTAARGRKTAEQMDRIFKAYPEAYHKAFVALEADLTPDLVGAAGKGFGAKVEEGAMNVLLWLNRAQSKIVRKAVMASSIDRKLKAVGSSLEDMLDTERIPAGFERILSESIDEAMFVDFTLAPKGKAPLASFFNAYAKIIDSVPLAPLFEPFPRFLFNAAKLTVEHTPTAGLRLITPKARAKMLEGNFEPFAKELTGTAMFAMAIALRSGYVENMEPGPRFDEVLTGSNKAPASLAPFATLAPFLFLADLVIRIDEGRLIPADFDAISELRRGLFGSAPQVARLNSSIEQAFEAIFSVNSFEDLQNLGSLAGEVGTGFLRPLQLLRDFRAEIDEAHAIFRETQGRGIWGPVEDSLRGALPEVFGPITDLPERESPTRGGPSGRPRLTLFRKDEFAPGNPAQDVTLGAGLASQVSGLLMRQPRNAIENELITLGFTGKSLSPKTGDKRFDALVSRYQGPVLETVGEMVVRSPVYMQLPVKAKQEIVRNLVTLSRQPALKAAQRIAPTMAAKLKLARMPGTKRELLVEHIDRMLRQEGRTLDIDAILGRIEDAAARELSEAGL